MSRYDRSKLDEVLTWWLHEQRVSYAHVARPGRISRNTVRLIAEGRTRQPSRDTICKIAVGLALDPYYGTTDSDVMRRSLRQLAAAAGYHDLVQDWLPATLETLLATRVHDLERARAWLRLIDQQRDANVDEIGRVADVLRRARHDPSTGNPERRRP